MMKRKGTIEGLPAYEIAPSGLRVSERTARRLVRLNGNGGRLPRHGYELRVHADGRDWWLSRTREDGRQTWWLREVRA